MVKEIRYFTICVIAFSSAWGLTSGPFELAKLYDEPRFLFLYVISFFVAIKILEFNQKRMTNIEQEDFETLGWEHLGAQWYNLKEVPVKLGHWNYVRLRKWDDNSAIIGYRSNPAEFEDTENAHLFQGNVESVEDLKKLMVQLHLK